MNILLKPVAYYNDVEDLVRLENKSADEIVEYMQNGLGHIYEMQGDDYGVACDGNERNIKYTSNGEYAVEFDFRGTLQYVEDDFINIYEVEKVKQKE